MWSQFENVMAKDPEAEGEVKDGEDVEEEGDRAEEEVEEETEEEDEDEETALGRNEDKR